MNRVEILKFNKMILESNKSEYLEILSEKMQEIMEITVIITNIEQAIEEVDMEMFYLQNVLDMKKMLDKQLSKSVGSIQSQPENLTEFIDVEIEDVLNQMQSVDIERLERYNAAAELIQSNLPNNEIYVEIHQIEGLTGLDYEMSIKIDTDKGPMNILSAKEANALNSGNMTLDDLMELVKSLRNK